MYRIYSRINYKSIFWVVKREVPEAPTSSRKDVFGHPRHYWVQLNNSQSWNKIITSCVCLAAGEEIDIHDALADTMSLNDWVNFFMNDDND